MGALSVAVPECVTSDQVRSLPRGFRHRPESRQAVADTFNDAKHRAVAALSEPDFLAPPETQQVVDGLREARAAIGRKNQSGVVFQKVQDVSEVMSRAEERVRPRVVWSSDMREFAAFTCEASIPRADVQINQSPFSRAFTLLLRR